MGGIFTSLMPEAKNTLIQSMTVMGVSMGAFIGVPPSMVEVYGTDIKKMYIANGIPLCFGVITLVVSAFIHLMIMSMIIFTLAPIVFHSTIPSNIPLYFITLALFVIVSLAISCVLGLAVKNQAKLTMYSQVVFLPSIMLSGIMFSAELLPNFLESIGKLFPATWGYTLLIQKNIDISTFLPLLLILAISVFASMQLLKKIRSE
jgi:ABC-2 type transport system permease protein